MEPPPVVPKRGRACATCNSGASGGSPGVVRAAREAESQAPDIRCLTFRPAAGSLEAAAGSPKPLRGPRGALREIGAESREPKVKPRIPVACLRDRGHQSGGGGGLARGAAGYPAVPGPLSGAAAGSPKSSTGYPVLDFGNLQGESGSRGELARQPLHIRRWPDVACESAGGYSVPGVGNRLSAPKNERHMFAPHIIGHAPLRKRAATLWDAGGLKQLPSTGRSEVHRPSKKFGGSDTTAPWVTL